MVKGNQQPAQSHLKSEMNARPFMCVQWSISYLGDGNDYMHLLSAHSRHRLKWREIPEWETGVTRLNESGAYVILLLPSFLVLAEGCLETSVCLGRSMPRCVMRFRSGKLAHHVEKIQESIIKVRTRVNSAGKGVWWRHRLLCRKRACWFILR